MKHFFLTISILLCVIPAASHADPPYSADPGAPNPSVYVDGSGNLGIGTTTPRFKLDLRGGLGLGGNIDGRRTAGPLAIHVNGWSQQGAGIELYPNQVQRKGMLAFVAGHGDGDPETAGGIPFNNYTGTGWRNHMEIQNTGSR